MRKPSFLRIIRSTKDFPEAPRNRKTFRRTVCPSERMRLNPDPSPTRIVNFRKTGRSSDSQSPQRGHLPAFSRFRKRNDHFQEWQIFSVHSGGDRFGIERNETVTKTIQLQLSAPNSLLTDNSKRNAVHLIRHIEFLSGQISPTFFILSELPEYSRRKFLFLLKF